MPTPREAYVNSVERAPMGGERLRAADFGSGGEMIGRAVQKFGGDLSKTADNLLEIQKKDAELAAQEADNIRTAKRMKRLYEGEGAYFGQQGKNALLDREKLDADLKAIDDEAESLLKGKPMAQQMFRQQTLRRNADDLPRISQHVAKEREKYEDQVDADSFDNAIDAAANGKDDPNIVVANIATVKDIATRQAQRKGMTDPLSIKNAQQAAVGKLVESVASSMENESPGEALAFVNMHADQMDPDDVSKLQKELAGRAADEEAGSLIGNYVTYVGGEEAPSAEGGSDAPSTPGSSPAGGGGAGPTLWPPEAALEAAQIGQESGGQHIDPKTGRLLESSAGARGVTQVMPKTGVDPGYGVTPLRNNSRAEYIRFRRDYMKAMSKEFGGNVVLALTAYNWGPGNVQDHIAKVGDPRKGEISDAAFLESIGNKEAREYAQIILGNAGVTISGSATRARGKPIALGREIDLDATLNKIRNDPNLTYVQKKALEGEATRAHSIGRTMKAEREEAASDAALSYVNNLPPDSFVSYDQLPLTIRTQLKSMPEVEAKFKSMAAANKSGRDSAAASEAEFALQDLSLNNPTAFNSIDIQKQYPQLTTSQLMEWKDKQAKSRESTEKPGASGRVDYDRVRTTIKRYQGKNAKASEMGPAFDMVIRNAEAWLRANPNETSVPDAVIEGIARRALMDVVVVRGNSRERMTYAEIAGDKARNKGKPATYQLDSREYVRSLLQTTWGRTPTEAEVDAEIETFKRNGAFR